jgi:hypothetical protein
MWAYNVTRTILNAGGYTVLPDKVPVQDSEILSIARNATEKPLAGCIYCLKVDSLLIRPGSSSLIITTYRDIRDAMVSLMRFIHCDFDKAMEIANVMMKVADHYMSLPPEVCLKLRFDDIVNLPVEQVGKISSFLRIPLKNDKIEQIVAQWNRSSVQKLIGDIGAGVKNEAGPGQAANNVAAVYNHDGTVRVFDRSTGFQSGHVSMSKGGEWRGILTFRQKERLNLIAAEWLERYGFDPG